MSDDDAQPHDLVEVLLLTTALAENMLASEIPTRSIDPARIRALIGAAELFHDHAVPLPTAVQKALDKIREQTGAAQSKLNDGSD